MATYTIIILNVAFFLLFALLTSFYSLTENSISVERLRDFTAISPEFFFKGYFWTLLTSMFLHANFTHLFVNMVSLFFLGTFIEHLIGRKRFVLFYLIAGLVAGISFVLFALFTLIFPGTASFFGNFGDYAVGASGAIFGLGGLLAVLLPRMKVLLFFFVPMRLWVAMALMMFGLWIFSAYAGLPIGNTAHFGGLVVGLVYGFYLRNKFPNKIRMLNRMFR